MMLDIARLIEENADKISNRVGLKFVFFDGEEAVERWTQDDSTYGARKLANKWQDDVFVCVLFIVGYAWQY